MTCFSVARPGGAWRAIRSGGMSPSWRSNSASVAGSLACFRALVILAAEVAVVLERDLYARLHGQFLGAEQFLPVHFTVNDPAVQVALPGRVGGGDRLQVVVVLEVRVHVGVPVELVHEVVEVVVPFRRHV